jgi:hypothetical protein
VDVGSIPAESTKKNSMLDQDLKKQLDSINKNLSEINRKTGTSVWRAFLNGTMSGLGSVVGVAIALAVVGFILNAVGVIPAFRGEVNKINQTLDYLKKK